MGPCLATYDVAGTYIKYKEGYIRIPHNGGIITKPQEYWSEENKKLVIYFNYVLCVNFSIQTVILFPILQWAFRNDAFYTELVPQLAYGSIMLIIGILGIRSHWRFQKLLIKTRKTNSNIVTKLEYFKVDN
ncbi:10738_t:CDS:2 [Diversispora eburnea]|uniref:10738_t:CDS:1 n=1 Tax=Diversispora eburnea TaxID=1213867 RepID=A0A9N8WKR3_9GLOM|nr:10738_t:CDS:2 [Diversispora eburnea]